MIYDAALFFTVFPECVVKGSRFTLWGSGGSGVFAGRRFCVRNLPRTTVVAESCRAYRKSCKRRDSWMFQVLRRFISRGRRGTL